MLLLAIDMNTANKRRQSQRVPRWHRQNSIIKTDVVPPVAAPDQAPAASTTVAPLPDAPAATPKAANPPATGTATPPATTTTP